MTADGADPKHPLTPTPVRRARPFWHWAALAAWFMALAVLLEYTLTSLTELEPQAAILAGAIFFGLLVAGIVTIVARGVANDSASTEIAQRQIHTQQQSNGVDHEPRG